MPTTQTAQTLQDVIELMLQEQPLPVQETSLGESMRTKAATYARPQFIEEFLTRLEDRARDHMLATQPNRRKPRWAIGLMPIIKAGTHPALR